VSSGRPRSRHHARQLLVQALYQWQLAPSDACDIEQQFTSHAEFETADTHYFQNVLYGVVDRIMEVDQLFAEFLDRPIAELTPVELSILRLSCYELRFRLDVPYKVVINEALELNKVFGCEDGHKYVNAVVDNVAKQYRQAERSGAGK
jgi:transcription antitermination protein NusB